MACAAPDTADHQATGSQGADSAAAESGPLSAGAADTAMALERIRVPQGAHFGAVADSLEAHGVVRAPGMFRLYARLVGATQDIKAGTYAFQRGTGWRVVLRTLSRGRILTERFTIPEGWDLRRIAPRLAELTGLGADSVLARLADTAAVQRFAVPGPTLEGYLYPATYVVPADAPLDTLIGRMVAEYRSVWTPERQAAADSIGMSEREVVTLASIVEKEARFRDELPLIAAVYRNRLQRGYMLQADPTVQYALGDHRERLLYADIDRVADNPYNTYRHRGLPPGPIGSPSAEAIDATLRPAAESYLYFVAAPDGRHVFTRSLVEHNRARAAIRRLQRMPDSGGVVTAARIDSIVAREH